MVMFYVHRVSGIDGVIGFQLSAANRRLQCRHDIIECSSLFCLRRLPFGWIRQIIRRVLHHRRGRRLNAVEVLGQQVDGLRVRCFLRTYQLRFDMLGWYVRFPIDSEATGHDQLSDRYNTSHFCG